MIVLDYTKDSELFNETAKKMADKIFSDKEYIEKKNGNKNYKSDPVKSTQMRKFYDKSLELHNKVFVDKEDFSDILPFIKMLNSKIEYAYSRELVSKSFKEVMNTCINQVNNSNDLKNFKLFFEAIIGFYKGRK